MTSARARFLLVTLAALVAAGVTARLGLWQLDRAAQKQAIEDAVARQASLPPLAATMPLPNDDAQLQALHYRRAQVAGRWSGAHTVHLDNRPMNGRPGFQVVTPLLLADGRALLVVRGWVPRDPQERTRLPDTTPPAGDVTVSGRIAPWPSRYFEFDGAPAGAIRQNLDRDAFARETGLRLLPLSMLQTEPAGAADGLQRDWPPPTTGVDKHHGYAFQWFGLSALVILLYVWFQFIQPRRARR